jgi:hypothetical protein
MIAIGPRENALSIRYRNRCIIDARIGSRVVRTDDDFVDGCPTPR